MLFPFDDHVFNIGAKSDMARFVFLLTKKMGLLTPHGKKLYRP